MTYMFKVLNFENSKHVSQQRVSRSSSGSENETVSTYIHPGTMHSIEITGTETTIMVFHIPVHTRLFVSEIVVVFSYAQTDE